MVPFTMSVKWAETSPHHLVVLVAQDALPSPVAVGARVPAFGAQVCGALPFLTAGATARSGRGAEQFATVFRFQAEVRVSERIWVKKETGESAGLSSLSEISIVPHVRSRSRSR